MVIKGTASGKRGVRKTVKKVSSRSVRAVKRVSAKRSAPVRPAASVPPSPRPPGNEKQRHMMRGCLLCLRRFADICRPRSRWGVFGVLCAGIVIGIVLAGVLLYVAKNESPIRILRGLNKTGDIVLMDGVPVRVSEEVDVSFIPPVMPPEDLRGVNLNPFWSVWRLIEGDFVPQPEQYTRRDDDSDGPVNRVPVEKPTRDDLLHGAIHGLTGATGDIYTNFFLPNDARDFESEVLDGEIDGIGAYISIIDGALTVIRPIPGSPAFLTGVRAEDRILEIDGVPSSRYNLTEAANAIRGPRGSAVVLKLYRPSSEESLSLTVIREQIDIPTVETEIRNDVFVITLSTFTKQTPKLFSDAVREFVAVANDGGPDRILLDMRGNAGGILSVAVYIANMFLPEDSVVLYEYDGTEILRAFRTDGPVFKNGVLPEVTVLVDGATASASEILAAALRHYGVADIIGTKTLGKGFRSGAAGYRRRRRSSENHGRPLAHS